MADVNPILTALVIVGLVTVIILIMLLIRHSRMSVRTTSTPTAVPCTAPPATPINLVVTNPQSDILALTWSRVSTATNYTAYISSIPNFNVTNALQSRTDVDNSISFGNLTLGVTYYLKVKATNSCGDSPLSSEVSSTLAFQFPQRFVIQSRLNPQLQLCDQHTSLFGATDQVRASRLCATADSLAFYQDSDNSIHQTDRPTRCFTRVAPDTIFFNNCDGSDSQRWVYNAQTSNLCGIGTSSNQCINLAANFNADGGQVNWGPPIDDIRSDWVFAPQ